MLSELAFRLRQFRRVHGESGWRGITSRLTRLALARLGSVDHSEVREVDLLSADLTLGRPVTLPQSSDPDRLTLNWVMTPPGVGSGGHTTAFRLIRHLEDQGHRCRVYLYDVYGGDAHHYGPRMRSMIPGLRADVLDVTDGLADADVHFATSWQTAYPVFSTPAAGLGGYLVQDFEPWFYPKGSSAFFAENTYRMGLHALTAGRWLALKLSEDYGMVAVPFDFGSDREVYRLSGGPASSRSGVVFYARPGAPRRAFELGMIAMRVFAERNPDTRIHLYGQELGHLPFPAIDHGLVSPEELNAIYNECRAGLSLSATNVSLVPHEMLASGCIPVVNDAEHNRVVLDNPHVRYADPTPHALADQLSRIVAMPDAEFADLAREASASVGSSSWSDAGQVAESAIREWIVRARSVVPQT